ncbi:MAG: hypothetical protein WCO91_13185 [Gemmataceae bacterium]
MVASSVGSPEFQAEEFLNSLVLPLGGFAFPPVEFVGSTYLPKASQELLVHHYHMTVTLEAHHKAPLCVKVLDRVQTGDAYTRRICLYETGLGKPVLYGVVRIHLDFCKREVREAILAEAEPLGRILIRHGVLTRIELLGLLRIRAENVPEAWFGPRGNDVKDVFGRLAVIHCDGKAAVELLEMI